MDQPVKPPLKTRIEALIREYGPVFVVIYFAIFLLVWAGFAVAIAAGVQVKSAGATAGTIGAAWVATKLTQPLRIMAAAALTPWIGRRWAKKP